MRYLLKINNFLKGKILQKNKNILIFSKFKRLKYSRKHFEPPQTKGSFLFISHKLLLWKNNGLISIQSQFKQIEKKNNIIKNLMRFD